MISNSGGVQITRQELSNVELHQTIHHSLNPKVKWVIYMTNCKSEKESKLFPERWMDAIKPLADNNLFSLDWTENMLHKSWLLQHFD